jgi:uncharacterized protein (DUF4415 family)
MKESKGNTDPGWVDPDEIPDLSTPEWEERIVKVSPGRGRPKADNPKVSTTIRLDPDLLEALKATGKGWQSRANEMLRKAIGI